MDLIERERERYYRTTRFESLIFSSQEIGYTKRFKRVHKRYKDCFIRIKWIEIR